MPTVSLTRCCSTPALIPGERGVLAGRMPHVETGAMIQTCCTLRPSAIAVNSQTRAARSWICRSRHSPSRGDRGDAAACCRVPPPAGQRAADAPAVPGDSGVVVRNIRGLRVCCEVSFPPLAVGEARKGAQPFPSSCFTAAPRNYIYPGSVVKQLPLGRAVSVFPHAAPSSSHECQSVKLRAVRRKKHLNLQKHKVDFTPEQHQAFWSPRCCNW